MSRVNLEITPSNITSDGTLSYRNGQPTVQFIIGEQDRMLIGQSVRLTGKLKCKKTSTTFSASNTNMNISQKLGVYSVIDQLNISSQRTSQSIESIRHYNRMMSSYLPVTTSQDDSLTHLGMEALINPNYELIKHSVTDNALTKSLGNSFCVPLPCGLFLGSDPIPLSGQHGIGGLNLEIQLAPDDNVFYNPNASTTTDLTEAFYELSDVKLVAEAIVPTAEDLSALRSQPNHTFNFNSISSYYSVINSANGILNFNLGMSKVLGVFCNVLPASHINNLSFDGMATLPFTNSDTDKSCATVNQCIFTRAGTRFPLEYNIDTIHKDRVNDSDRVTGDSQLIRNYMNAVLQFSKNLRTQVSPQNYQIANGGTDYNTAKTVIEGGDAWGLGINYDTISNDGVDFSTTNWGLNLNLDLNTVNPQAIFVFVHSKNTLLTTPSGLQVIH
jgi:hypothetical protein